ncbi:DNA sulfur modification protein DndD [Candidatus Magnetoovum chiemensis]|nr:DNA sulfur modification protein DndD [Candidatus Magnetoovum chiemensis]
MIFKEVCIRNLFCYYGEHICLLEGFEEHRNIVLIFGRNGYGKTSFLRSVKLLFCGANEQMRSSEIQKHKLTIKEYLIGRDNEWSGCFNIRARNDGVKDFGVKITWIEDKDIVEASRQWNIDKTLNDKGNLSITVNSQQLNEDEAQTFLDKRLPSVYVPFFFFDGEQLQQLAEANREDKRKQIELLLNITHIDNLIEKLNEIRNKWKKDAADEAAKAELTELENKADQINADKNKWQQEEKDLLDEINELKNKKTAISSKIDTLRFSKGQKDEASLKDQKKRLNDDIEERLDVFAKDFCVDAPMAVNRMLVERAAKECEKVLDAMKKAEIAMVEEMIDTLPADLFDKPPHPSPILKDNQKNFYKKRLHDLLQVYKPNPSHLSDSVFNNMKQEQASKLLEQLRDYIHNDGKVQGYLKYIKNIINNKRQLNDIDDKIEETSNLAAQDREEHEKLTNELNIIDGDIEKKNIELGKIQSNLSGADKTLKDLERQIDKQYDKVQIAGKTRKKYDKAGLLKALFEKYKNELKSLRKEEIETKINEMSKKLLTSNTMIAKIKVTEDFDLHYIDSKDQTIGIASVSAGMKQLTATALLWALKEASGKDIPLIIDMPLARIDREHQSKLLTHYYPNAGKQIIILPTDSEIDNNKYETLKPYIYREYTLKNPDGDNSSFTMESMY